MVSLCISIDVDRNNTKLFNMLGGMAFRYSRRRVFNSRFNLIDGLVDVHARSRHVILPAISSLSIRQPSRSHSSATPGPSSNVVKPSPYVIPREQSGHIPLSELIQIIVPAYLNDAFQRGTFDWDKVILKSLSILLSGAIYPERQSLPVYIPSSMVSMQFSDIVVKVPPMSTGYNIVAEINYKTKISNKSVHFIAITEYRSGPWYNNY